VRARWAGGALIAVLAIVFAIDLAGVVTEWDALRPIGAGAEAPDFELPRIDAGGRIGPDRVALASLRGRPVIVDFWETWCRPCRESMPIIERVVARHRGEVALVSVCSDGTRRPVEARRLVDELAPSATLLADEGTVADRYGVATIPHLVVIAADGSIVHVHRRFAGGVALERHLAAALKQAVAR
jgi:cytochrome c biogenesis protein CcmG/thiol:disulfide interchange protein DsbE